MIAVSPAKKIFPWLEKKGIMATFFIHALHGSLVPNRAACCRF